MRLFNLMVATLAGFLPLSAPGDSNADFVHPQPRADVSVFDQTTGRELSVHIHHGRAYVAGEPGHRYELRLDNRSGERLLAVTSVDGVNVITGATAGWQQSGYVMNPYDGVRIEGWRKSMDEIATFYFTRLSRSYAARTGRPHDVGVIGVALFRERRYCCDYRPMESAAEASGAPDEDSTARPQAKQEANAASAPRAREKLGTGQGHRETSRAEYVNFERASESPDETIVIYYDSYENLVARGVIPVRRHPREQHRPEPFPQDAFVPDP